MTIPTHPAVHAAREAEAAVWRHYGLQVSERFVDVDPGAVRVRIVECGNAAGPPLVFVNGGLGEAVLMTSLMARLTGFRCITLDRPGGGFSDGVDFTAVDVRGLAVSVLTAVLDACDVQRAPFVANSMGGWWTFQLALARPERVGRVVMLGCPAILLGTSAPTPLRLLSVPVLGHGMARLMVSGSPEKARGLPEVLGHPPEVGRSWSDAQAEAVFRLSQLPNFQRSWRTLARRFLTIRGGNPEVRISEDDLRRVPQPTLFVWGSEDPFGPPEAGREAVRLMPDARLEIAGRGHLPWLDEPDTCARLISEFVREE